jgi:hypothetical protein
MHCTEKDGAADVGSLPGGTAAGGRVAADVTGGAAIAEGAADAAGVEDGFGGVLDASVGGGVCRTGVGLGDEQPHQATSPNKVHRRELRKRMVASWHKLRWRGQKKLRRVFENVEGLTFAPRFFRRKNVNRPNHPNN